MARTESEGEAPPRPSPTYSSGVRGANAHGASPRLLSPHASLPRCLALAPPPHTSPSPHLTSLRASPSCRLTLASPPPRATPPRACFRSFAPVSTSPRSWRRGEGRRRALAAGGGEREKRVRDERKMKEERFRVISKVWLSGRLNLSVFRNRLYRPFASEN